MSSRGADLTSLRKALAAVERRLAGQGRARRAVMVGAGAAVPAALVAPGLVGAAVVTAAAGLGAALARPPAGRAAAWLDRHGVDDDLMISGAAVADGRVATELADIVLGAAGARARDARRPARWPALAAAPAVLALAAGVAILPALRAPRSTAAAAATVELTRTVRELARDRADAPPPRLRPAPEPAAGSAALIVVEPGPTPPAPPVAPDPVAAGHGAGESIVPQLARHGAGTGAGAGDRAAERPTADGATSPPAPAAVGSLVSSAPRAGATVALHGVPERYRGLVAGYLTGPGAAR